MEKKHVIMLLIALLIVAIPFFLYSGKGESYFSGSDDKASLAIEETGYHPWFSSIWEPRVVKWKAYFLHCKLR